MSEKRVNLFGLFIDDISLSDAVDRARSAISGGEGLRVFTPNLEILDGARRSAGMCRILNTADLSLPDGFGVKIVSRLLGRSLKNTVAGIDFGEELLGVCTASGARVYLLGGKEGRAERAAENLSKKYPNLIICGTRNGYFSSSDTLTVCGEIRAAEPDVLIVCRGFPRQEKFVCDNAEHLACVKIFACLGGALDVWSGEVRRAPRIIRKMRLEWLWRIASDPSRADRFVCSLPTLLLAFEVFVRNLLSANGIKRRRGAYNQVKSKP